MALTVDGSKEARRGSNIRPVELKARSEGADVAVAA